MVRGGPLGGCGRTVRPLSGTGEYQSGTCCGLSSKKRAYQAELWPTSGGGRRWPITWRPGCVAHIEIEEYPILSTKAPRVFPIWAIAHKKSESMAAHVLILLILQLTALEGSVLFSTADTACASARSTTIQHTTPCRNKNLRADYFQTKKVDMAHNEHDGFGKISPISHHAHMYRTYLGKRLRYPRCRKNRLHLIPPGPRIMNKASWGERQARTVRERPKEKKGKESKASGNPPDGLSSSQDFVLVRG